MAGDWIKMQVHLDGEPEVVRMAAALGLHELDVVGRLWKVWAWADTHSLDGNNVGVTCAYLDRITNCPGFTKAMRDERWLSGRDGALSFPRFDRHNGQTAKKRALTKDRVAEHRKPSSVTDVTPHALPEKKREEKKPPPPAPQGAEDDGELLDGLDVAEELYALYPRKTAARQRAIRAIWAALQRVDADTLRAAIKRYAATPDLHRENGRFIATPIRWFTDDCWKDYLPPPSRPTTPVRKPSTALESLRAIFELRPVDLSEDEKALASTYVHQLTEDDWSFLSQSELERIAQNGLLRERQAA